MHPTRWAVTFTVSALTAICDNKPIISIFRIFLRKVIGSCFWCKFISFASCARAYETWKQCQWIMRTLAYKHKIRGENWLCLRPYLKAFPVFKVLETCRKYFLKIDPEIVEFRKNLSSGFWKNAKFLGMDQITSKNCIKSSWMQVNKIFLTRHRPEQFPSFFYAVFNGIKPLWDEAAIPKLIIFLKY